jgi:hypothetical protein
MSAIKECSMRLRIVWVPIAVLVAGCDSTLALGSDDASAGDAPGERGGSGEGHANPAPSTGDDSGGFVDPLDCAIECEGAAEDGCNFVPASVECVKLCADSPNESQLDCLKNSPCATLVSALQGKGTLCGIAPHDAGPAPIPEAGGSPVSPGDCAIECEGAAENGCNFGPASAECVKLCANSPNQAQLECLQNSPCSVLVSALGMGTSICGF